MEITHKIIEIAREIAHKSRGFHDVKGPGKGDVANNQFMKELRGQVEKELGRDYSEKQISGNIKSAVDFYIPEENSVIEIAMSLKTPLSEFHKDIFKVILAKDRGVAIDHLFFLSKPGAIKTHSAPASTAIIEWLKKNHDITVTIEEFDM